MDANGCDRLYLEINGESECEVSCPVHTLISVFLSSYCDSNSILITLVRRANSKKHVSVPLDALLPFGIQRASDQNIPKVVRQCTLPAILSSDGRSVRSGLCGVLRHMVHLAERKEPHRQHKKLLGYKAMCLKCCAEVSAWTNFCEVELPNLVSHLCQLDNWSMQKDLLPVLLKFENHLKKPPVIHNINKLRDEAVRNALKTRVGETESSIDVNSLPELQHLFAEGPNMTLTDILLYPCVYYIMSNLQTNDESMSSMLHHCKLVCEWFERMRIQSQIKVASSDCGFKHIPALESFQAVSTTFSVLGSGIEHLSIREETSKKVKASRSQVNNIIEKLQDAKINAEEDSHPMEGQLRLNWDKLPEAVNPREGDLPKRRIQRKCEQLENLVAAVRHIANDGQTIVDFCAGGGHVGILLAYLLPSCKVILVENKEESIRRARERIAKLKLENVITYQCNMDYFTGDFDIGICLHACGVATDLVLQCCIDKGANFVICPCCYGGIRDTFTMKYPRSRAFKNSPISYKEYLILGHAADQTEFNIPRAQQGKQCMLHIDRDRALLAEEHGYEVILCSLHPLTCSPKNNLIIGTKTRGTTLCGNTV